jgi:hypothetical protein
MDQERRNAEARRVGEAAREAGITLDDYENPCTSQLMAQCIVLGISFPTLIAR